ncbi:MAG: cupredoxin domain-containing protein [Candidatus Pacebacteria bacterium]|nr:cupredoxin domain-containing protein [Candidatus Paceibacterota bacterium]
MLKKNIGLVIVLIVLIVAGYLVWMRFGDTQTATYQPLVEEEPGRGVVGDEKRDTDPYDIQIVYTDDGYVPKNISIKKGTRVRFLNGSTEPTWPASGIHPTHTLYPEKKQTDCLGSSFDSCASLTPGQFFDYTFNYVGEWSFHDHLHGYNSGEIIVE